MSQGLRYHNKNITARMKNICFCKMTLHLYSIVRVDAAELHELWYIDATTSTSFKDCLPSFYNQKNAETPLRWSLTLRPLKIMD